MLFKNLLVLTYLSTLQGYLDDYGSMSLRILYYYWEANWLTLYSYTGDLLKCFELVALHLYQFDWLNNERGFLLNWSSMALPLFVVYQHKERFCKYRGMKNRSATSIITHTCVILKDYIVRRLFSASRGKEFCQLIDIGMVPGI